MEQRNSIMIDGPDPTSVDLGLRVSKGRRFKQTELMSPPWLQVGPYIYKHENFSFVSSYLLLRRF